uniref:Uncharacterized protein n=1 Tax=Candidatus Kentrum eta TaxID=2126337 RepID=A0A450U8X1_9GAMM|nr:MAG: hypothetical protein BECKH772A_GA0070896_1000828 [Candidatus Kentron sp. H]
MTRLATPMTRKASGESGQASPTGWRVALEGRFPCPSSNTKEPVAAKPEGKAEASGSLCW